MRFRALKDLELDHGSVQLIGENANAYRHAKRRDIVLVPQPSNDPKDPLRWPRWKKLMPLALVTFFSFMVSWVITGLSTGFVLLSEEFDRPLASIAQLLSLCILVLGLANFFWVPLAIYFGKRPIFVTASLIYFVSCIWSSLSKSYSSLLGARIVMAFAGGSTEALAAALVNDLFFLHERGAMTGVVLLLLSAGNSLGPLCSGFIISALGWRWFSWIGTIICGILFIGILLGVPETRFDRAHLMAVDGQSSHQPEASTETAEETVASVAKRPQSQHLEQVACDPTNLSKMTYVRELGLSSGVSKQSFWSLLLRPFPMLPYPAVIWATLGYSISLACVVTVTSINSFVLQVPPYNFSPAISGLVNIPALLGTLLGAFTGGYLTDVYSTWDARRNKGKFRPESRMVLLVIPGLLVPVGLLMFGFGPSRHFHWIVLFVANGFIAVGTANVATIGQVYVSESYFPVAPEALLLVNGIKNVIAFGYAYGITPWTASVGYERAFGTLAGVFVAVILFAVPLYVFGEKLRKASASWKLLFW